MDNAPTSIVAAIDVGTFKVSVVIAKIFDNTHIEVLGMANTPNLGMSRGVIRNMDHVVASIKEAVSLAEEMADLRVHSAWVSIPPIDLISTNASGTTITHDGTVTATDLSSTLDMAKRTCLRPDYYLMNSMPLGFEIDAHEDWVDQPIGMAGRKISSHYHLMMLPISTMQNIEKAMKAADVSVDKMVMSTIATAEAALLHDEKEYGVCLIDIGGGTTSIIVYFENKLILSHCFPIGGELVTRDIASVLKTSNEHAESIKIRQGSVDPTTLKVDEMIRVPGIGGATGRLVSPEELSDIIIARYSEIFETVRDYLINSGAINMLRHGIVLAGGASQIHGAVQLCQQIFGLQTHLYHHPNSVYASEEQRIHLCRLVYATTSGLLIHSQNEIYKHQNDLVLGNSQSLNWFYRILLSPWQRFKEKLQQVV